MDASSSSSPFGIWQVAHPLSSTWGRFTWLAPVAKLTSSWQAPQAARLGLVYQALAWAAPVAASWHSAQRRGSEGRITVDQSVVPMAYFPPAITLGNWLPMWILCAITFMSTVCPPVASLVCGW